MNQLARIETVDRPPPACDRELRLGIHHLVSGANLSGGRPVLLPGRAVDAALRASLEARLAALDRSLDHRDDRAVDAAVTGLTMLYSAARLDSDEDTGTIGEMYVRALSDLPAWAVLAAIDALGRPTDGKRHEFPPSEPTIHSLAYARCRLWIEERQEIRTLLSIDARPEPTADEKSRVGDLVAGLGRTFRRDIADRALEDRAAGLERRRADGLAAAAREKRIADDLIADDRAEENVELPEARHDRL